jgi:hypothetical protein
VNTAEMMSNGCRGTDLLGHPLLNKDLGFSQQRRETRSASVGSSRRGLGSPTWPSFDSTATGDPHDASRERDEPPPVTRGN